MAPRTLAIEPLTKAGFAPFGTVIERDGAEIMMINEGTTTRYHALSAVDVASGGGRPILSIFAGTPRPAPIAISMMERHPLGAQAFMPLSDYEWLVVVARPTGMTAHRILTGFAASARAVIRASPMPRTSGIIRFWSCSRRIF